MKRQFEIGKSNFVDHLYKHFEQIKNGGVVVIVKKFRSFIYLALQLPIYSILIPVVILIRLIRPWFLIRWQEIISSRLLHFVINTEIYCCERDAGINVPSQKYIDLFYLRKQVCNKQIEKMWRRSSLIILPAWLLFPLFKINRFMNIFVDNGDYHEIRYVNKDRDINNLLEKFPPHISLTQDEEIEAKSILTKFGIPEDAKFVCLAVRDSAYLNRYKETTLRDWSYHNYRDGDIDRYVLAAEELVKRGYHVFRTGVKVLKPLKSSNPKVIDYANSGIRSDLMDVYLGAKCRFCISTHTGFDGIPSVFRKPIIYVLVPLANLITHNENNLMITKHHVHKKNKKKLTISEIFSLGVAYFVQSKKFELNNIKLEENSSEEIRDLAIEMDERLNGNWKETKEDLLLQKKFWSIFEEKIKALNLTQPIHGEIKGRFGSKFLRDNQNWIM